MFQKKKLGQQTEGMGCVLAGWGCQSLDGLRHGDYDGGEMTRSNGVVWMPFNTQTFRKNKGKRPENNGNEGPTSTQPIGALWYIHGKLLAVEGVNGAIMVKDEQC